MTREEEIKEQSTKYMWKQRKSHFEGYDIEYAFAEGAKWADEHPSINTVKKIICYALKKTNIMLAEDLENGVEWELLIKKAMKGQ